MKTVPKAALASNAFFTRTPPSLACRNSTMKQCYFTVMAQTGRSSLFVYFVSFPQHGDLEGVPRTESTARQTHRSFFLRRVARVRRARLWLCARRKQKVRESGNSAVARSLLTAIKRRPPRTTDVVQAEAAGAALAAAPVDESRKGKASDRAVAGYGWTPSICDISRTARESW